MASKREALKEVKYYKHKESGKISQMSVFGFNALPPKRKAELKEVAKPIVPKAAKDDK